MIANSIDTTNLIRVYPANLDAIADIAMSIPEPQRTLLTFLAQRVKPEELADGIRAAERVADVHGETERVPREPYSGGELIEVRKLN